MSAVMSSPSIDVSKPSVPAAANLSAQDRVVGAIERLALSREQLRSTMMPAPPKSSSHAARIGSGDVSFTANLAERVKEIPGAAMVIDAVQTWWAQHPLRTATLVAGEASRKPNSGVTSLAGISGALMPVARPEVARSFRLMEAIFMMSVNSSATAMRSDDVFGLKLTTSQRTPVS
jgi:hypothetical protein